MIPLDTAHLAGQPLELVRAWPTDAGLRVEYRAADGCLFVGLRHDVAGALARAGREHGDVADDDPCLVLRPFGIDPALPSLAAAIAAGGTVVSHRPGRRAVVRTTAGTYLKLVRAGKAEGIARRHELLAHALRGVARVPHVLAVADDLVELEPLRGKPLGGEPGTLSTPGDPEAWSAAGRALATLAGVTSSALPAHDLPAEIATTERWLRAAASAGRLPEAEVRVAIPRLRAVSGSGRSLRAMAHRDLHDGQLLWDGETIGIIDADTLALADPALDLANLLVHLELRELQGTMTAGTRAAASQRVLAAAGRRGTVLEGLEPFTLTARLRLAAVYAFRPSWTGASRALLEAAMLEEQSAVPA